MNPAMHTFSNRMIDDVARRVYFKAMTLLDALLDNQSASPEKMMALAQVADAAGAGFDEEPEAEAKSAWS